MARLVITQSSRARWGIVLREGVTRVGKAGNQDVRIDDPSVADTHCELVVSTGRVFVRDLGSGLETLSDGSRVVGTTRIRDGQVLRLGKVDMRIEAEFSDMEPLTSIGALPSQDPQKEDKLPSTELPEHLTRGTPRDYQRRHRTRDASVLTQPAIEHQLRQLRRRCRALSLLLATLALVAISLVAYHLMGAK